jgi:hypothetical protein
MPVEMIGQRFAAVLARCFVYSSWSLSLRLVRCGLGNCLIFFEGPQGRTQRFPFPPSPVPCLHLKYRCHMTNYDRRAVAKSSSGR